MATGSQVQIQEPEVTFEELAQSARKLRKPLLQIPVYQAEDPTGISSTTLKVDTKGGKFFNLAGQRVNKGYKGLVVRDGKKYMAK